MRIALWAAGTSIVVAATGCADRFRPAAPDHASAFQAAHRGQQRLLVSALPADLAWLADGLKLYQEVGRGAGSSDDAADRPRADWMSVIPSSLPSSESSPDSTSLSPET